MEVLLFWEIKWKINEPVLGGKHHGCGWFLEESCLSEQRPAHSSPRQIQSPGYEETRVKAPQ